MFTRDDLMDLLRRCPVVPFRLHLSDGTSVDVRHRDYVLPLRRYAVIALPDPADPDATYDRYLVVFYMHVTKAETLSPGPPPGESAPPTGPAGSPESPTPSPSPV